MSRSRRFAALVSLTALVLTLSGLTLPAAVAGTGHPRPVGAGRFFPQAANTLRYPCKAPFGSVQIPASAWAGSLANTGHDGATFDVFSNYRAGRVHAACAGNWVHADGTNQWGMRYQCTELAVRVADGEWGIGNNAAWQNAGWNGAADAMKAPGQRLGLTWTSNGSGSLPVLGDLMVWSSSGGGDPGHVGVVSAVGAGTVTFVGENQGFGMVTLPVSGTTVENNGWKPGSSIVGWLSNPSTQMIITGDAAIHAKASIGNGGWTQEVGPGNAQAIAAGGNYQAFLRGDSAVFAKASIGNGGWTQETDPGTANEIAISSTGVQMMRTGDAAIWDKKTIGNGGWTQVASPGNAQAIAVGGNTEMFIRGDAAVFAKTYGAAGWTQETSPGNATAIAVSSAGVQMFLRGDGAIFAMNTVGGTWAQETDPGAATAIAAGGNTQMYIGTNSAVYAKNTIGYQGWTPETTAGNATAIAAGGNGVQLFLRNDSAVFATNAIGGAWTQETNPATASAIAAG